MTQAWLIPLELAQPVFRYEHVALMGERQMAPALDNRRRNLRLRPCSHANLLVEPSLDRRPHQRGDLLRNAQLSALGAEKKRIRQAWGHGRRSRLVPRLPGQSHWNAM